MHDFVRSFISNTFFTNLVFPFKMAMLLHCNNWIRRLSIVENSKVSEQIESQRQKRYFWTCVLSEDSDQTDLNLHWSHFVQPRIQSFFMPTKKTDQIVQANLSLLGRKCQIVRFLMLRLTSDSKHYLNLENISLILGSFINIRRKRRTPCALVSRANNGQVLRIVSIWFSVKPSPF